MEKKQQPQKTGTTPLMEQYRKIKAKHPDTILLFRVGDFYETFDEDAHKLHEITDIKLTKRSNGAAAAVPLAGFPHHALDNYLTKLVQSGLRVAVCDQLEAPQKGKQIVERGVTELITPGVTYHDTLLDRKSNNYLASLHLSDTTLGISFLDISTGEFLLAQGTEEDIEQLLERFQPTEIIFSKKHKKKCLALLHDTKHTYALENWIYQGDAAHAQLLEHFETKSLKGFGVDHLHTATTAAGAILHYLKTTAHTQLKHITKLSRIDKSHYMWLDRFTIRNLELLKPQQDEGLPLVEVLDKTLTPMGGRKLKKWLLFPLQNLSRIQERHGWIAKLLKNSQLAEMIRTKLKTIGDLERLTSKISTYRITPRQIYGLKIALEYVEDIKNILSKEKEPYVKALTEKLISCQRLIEQINIVINPDVLIESLPEGYIKKGCVQKLDDLNELLTENNEYLEKIQETQRQKTQISSLKIGYNKVFGYYLEVTNTHKDKVPAEWTRKQTLTHAERYITEELKVYEEKILYAQENIERLEAEVYTELLRYANTFIPKIQAAAKVMATLDVYQSLATVAKMYNYVQPQMEADGALSIEKGRHPVIEYTLPPDCAYVPNDVTLDPTQQQILLITGPNMAGKSALLRQTAIITLLAHMGSFVPAQKARIPLTDKIFTRVGASDNLARRESTFMVEMNEMASILHNLSPKSLLIIDELGRGTGTSDGTALAQSILEYLHEIPAHPKTLFATHYHHLNQLADRHPRIKNYKVAVREVEDKIVFLHQLEAGSSQHSFGIHVADMAGMPPKVLTRARHLLAQSQHSTHAVSPAPSAPPVRPIAKEDPTLEKIKTTLKNLDPLRLTPMQALVELEQLCELLKKMP